MEELPVLLTDLGLILFSAAIVTLIFKKLKQPLVLGYIVAGFLVSPHMPYTQSVVDEADISVWANIGVIFLLFSLGLEFSFKKIAKMGAAPIIAAITIVFCMMLLGNCVGHLFGWGDMDCVFLGGMLAMSSTTIIFKAFDDMGLLQQKFSSLVMSVLILEDILAIVLMVMLSAFAVKGDLNGGQLVSSVLRIGFYVLVWFLCGIFLIPMLLRKLRGILNEETLLIISIALCLGMAIFSTKVGFSSAFGAFIMGSILAETLEVDKIVKVFNPVKNLFGAVFFVSVGMLVDPKIIVEYAFPIAMLVLTIIVGHAVFSSFAYFISGQNLKNSMKCGFSMAQIGEFAFIIASLGLSLKVISPYLYPVVVAVSVITTFLTPYMIKFATPAYERLEKALPDKWIYMLDHLTIATPTLSDKQQLWKTYIVRLIKQMVIYYVICLALGLIVYTVGLPFFKSFLSEGWANAVSAVIALLLMAPFLRGIAMKNLRGKEFVELWNDRMINRLPLTFIILARWAFCMIIIFYTLITYSDRFGLSLSLAIAFIAVVVIVSSRSLNRRGMTIERLFMENLNARENYMESMKKSGRRKLNDERLIDRDIHIASITIPDNSQFVGQSLHDLHFGSRYGIHISSIIRGSYRINIPGGVNVLFPGDVLNVIGNDSQLATFNKAITETVNTDIVKYENMKLLQIELTSRCPFVGKVIGDSGLRDDFKCMALGLEEGKEQLTPIANTRKFREGDRLWVVGEEPNVRRLASLM
ncbi:MAG: cation:proton antiporter [Prevotellaceae bacterium]|nr:cation:proton antiporter [Prevotellaceae bacterium]